MKNLNTKMKLRAIWIAAILGAVLFAGIGLAEIIAYYFGALDNSYAVLLVVWTLAIPSSIVRHFIGMDYTTFGQSWAFNLIVNVPIGAFAFAAIAVFWQFVVKRGDEIKS